ncbi:phosphoribosylanthranilate isomerase [bacterium AH-315-M05]|nr:phosphoribosylanthranilate isomerase [bacterium AH-315-M05]
MKLKVCGMREHDNIAAVAALKPDFMGFIFYERSQRFVGEGLDEKQLKVLNGRIKKVGVFVNPSATYIMEQVKKYHLNLVQLHGDETPSFCCELKSYGLRIIKVFRIDNHFDFSQLNDYKAHCDYFLFDTKGLDYGGTGKTFDWKLLKQYDNKMPFFLSGGIGLEHINEFKQLKGWNVFAVDINSRFEISPALKNIEKIKRFKELIQ